MLTHSSEIFKMFVTPLVSTWLEQGLIVPTLVPKTKTLMSTNFEFLTSASPFECYPQSLDNTQNKQTQGLWSKFLVYHSNSTFPLRNRTQFDQHQQPWSFICDTGSILWCTTTSTSTWFVYGLQGVFWRFAVFCSVWRKLHSRLIYTKL